jgi:hypothetical protein
MNSANVYVFALVTDDAKALPRILRAAFTHAWVEGYQIGFGPPLVHSTPALTERVRACGSALEKLEVYLEQCILDAEECKRLAELQRRLLVRRLGPVEAESLTEASRQALDLRIHLKSPSGASPELRASLTSMKLDLKKLSESQKPALDGHFIIRLNDPKNTRLRQLPELSSKHEFTGPDVTVLELRTVVTCREYWAAFLQDLSSAEECTMVDIADPRAWAKVSRDGRQF